MFSLIKIEKYISNLFVITVILFWGKEVIGSRKEDEKSSLIFYFPKFYKLI